MPNPSAKSVKPAVDNEDDSRCHEEDSVVSVSSIDFDFTTDSKDVIGDPAAAMVLTKRDGHLAGGGGGECSSCWGTKSGGSERKSTTSAKNPFAKLCNPCLDDLGRHVRKPQLGPLSEAYHELLRDCALPVFTDSERKSANPELLRILESVNDATTLQDFYFQVGITQKKAIGGRFFKTTDKIADESATS